MTSELTTAVAEINEILQYLSIDQVNKIPFKLRNTFALISPADYIPHINPNKSILEQNISSKTRDILVLFYRNYWSNGDTRADIDKVLIDNERKYQIELNQKYSIDNMFSSSNNPSTFPKDNENQNNKLIIKKESFITKIINKIKSCFWNK